MPSRAPLRKMDAKIFSRTDKFVGFVCITGPPGGGKGTVIYTLRRFGGDGRANLCHNMGATYLFDDRVRGAEDCKPVLACSGLLRRVPESQDQPGDRETAHLRQGGSSQRLLRRGQGGAGNFHGDHSHAHWCRELPHQRPPWNRRDGRQDLGSHPRVHFRERGTGFRFLSKV